jgi:hypothetical protein
MYFSKGAYLVIPLTIGTPGKTYAKVAHLHLYIKSKLEDAFVLGKRRIFQIINACNVNLQGFGIQHLKIAKYAPKRFSLTFISRLVFVQQIFHF